MYAHKELCDQFEQYHDDLVDDAVNFMVILGLVCIGLGVIGGIVQQDWMPLVFLSLIGLGCIAPWFIPKSPDNQDPPPPDRESIPVISFSIFSPKLFHCNQYQLPTVIVHMNKSKIIYSALAIVFGACMVVFGGYDDSPGAQLLGLVAVIAGIVVLIKKKKIT